MMYIIIINKNYMYNMFIIIWVDMRIKYVVLS